MLRRISYIVLSTIVIIICLLSAIDIQSFNRDFYQKEYQKLLVYQTIGMSESDLMNVTDHLLDYVQGEKEDLVIYANINGDHREVFNDKEKLHMVDVKELYLNVMKVRNVLFFIAVALGYILFRKKGFNCLGEYIAAYKKTLLTLLAILIALGLMIAFDFDKTWRLFHEIFFTNDLWLLNPATDILIMMVPLEFFFDLVIRIVFTFVLGVLLFTGCIYILNKRSKPSD